MPQDYIKITIVATGFEKNVPTKELSNNGDFVGENIPPRAKVRPRLVVGGDLNSDYLDIPAYMRQQQD